jgi:thymidylate synthase (FAD)
MRDGASLLCDDAGMTIPTEAPVVSFRSDMTVQLVRSSASDNDVVFAAKVSTQGPESMAELDADPAKSAGLINYLMRDRHGSPFEHNSLTFFVQAPIFVFREHMRHRIASYNEESGRYKELEGVFYMPDDDRALVQVGKPGAYRFEAGTDEQHDLVERCITSVSAIAYADYQDMLDHGVAREVARMVLPLNLYSSMYVTMNARALMNFLSLRRRVDGQAYPSFPQREIEMVAEQMEDAWAQLMPLTHAAFVRNGRVAP